MKKYKPNIVMTFLSNILWIFISLIPAFMMLSLFINPTDIIYVIPFFIFLFLIVFIIGSVINFVVSLFMKATVTLNETSLIHNQTSIEYRNVKRIEFNHFSSKEGVISSSLIIYDELGVVTKIDQPSLRLILNLKKCCKKADFEILKLKYIPIYSIIFVIVVLLLYIIGIR